MTDIITAFKAGFFQGDFKTMKRPQKFNLTLSFKTQSSHQNVKYSQNEVVYHELNSSRMEIIFQLETRELNRSFHFK